ncbi:hypothetical protein DXU77_03215 [Pseudomonas lactis]|nr:hypothetical protein [Pseudomonas lactis]
MLAKNSRTPRQIRKPALSLTIFASKLAPTKCSTGPERLASPPSPRIMPSFSTCASRAAACGRKRTP